MNWVRELRVFFYDSRIKSVRGGAMFCGIRQSIGIVQTL